MTERKFSMSPMSLIFFICVLTLGIADLGFVVFGGVDASLPQWVVARVVGEKAIPYTPPLSIMIFSVGAVCGHLFWPMVEEK